MSTEDKYPHTSNASNASMMAYTTPINAVYKTGPQTPMLPMLMLQTEFISTPNPSSILTQEVPH